MISASILAYSVAGKLKAKDVYYFTSEELTKKEWILDIIEAIVLEATERNFHCIAMPYLGALHAKFPKDTFLSMLQKTLEKIATTSLRKIYLCESIPYSSSLNKNKI